MRGVVVWWCDDVLKNDLIFIHYYNTLHSIGNIIFQVSIINNQKN